MQSRQSKYTNKMLEKGFVTVRSWIPEGKKQELKQITKDWREEKSQARNCEVIKGGENEANI